MYSIAYQKKKNNRMPKAFGQYCIYVCSLGELCWQYVPLNQQVMGKNVTKAVVILECSLI